MWRRTAAALVEVWRRPAPRRFSCGAQDALRVLGVDANNPGVFCGHWLGAAELSHTQINPATGETIARVAMGGRREYEVVIAAMDRVKREWSATPAPVRGQVVQRLGDKLRERKAELGMLISLEMGKIYTEGLGEVQEAIDICDYAVGLSRCLNGAVIPSERPGHVMLEQYHPLQGHVGIITAFNFPVAVYFWNLALSLVCGNTNLWKPHESLSATSVAVTKLVAAVLDECRQPGAIASMICGRGSDVGAAMVEDPRMELISFTGSTKVGREVNKAIAGRFGKSILELGGNNAMVVDKSADLDMAIRATLFGAVGTAGQRCTTQRRLYLHRDIHDQFLSRLLPAYASVKIGNPLEPDVLCGPVHNQAAVDTFLSTVAEAQTQGGQVLFGGSALRHLPGFFVQPTVIAIGADAAVVQDERFVPILYVMKIDDIDEGIRRNNAARHGLSSSLFSQDIGQIFTWLGPHGSDCGIVNVNIGTSGAEIGGAFGGEKETGGGRESGSDAWKQYMRRSTCTVNYSKHLPLAQGVTFT